MCSTPPFILQMAAKMAKRAFGSRFQKSIVFCIGKALKAAHKLKNSKTGRYMTALLATSDPSADVWISKMEGAMWRPLCWLLRTPLEPAKLAAPRAGRTRLVLLVQPSCLLPGVHAAELLGMKCAATPGFDGIFVKKDGIDLHMTKRTKSGYVGVGSDPGRARVGFNVANQATGSNFHRTSVAAALVVAQLHGPAICRACKPLFHNCWKPFTACTCEV